MTVSRFDVAQWCQTITEKTDKFLSLDECLNLIPDLEDLSDQPAGTRVLVRGDVDVTINETGEIDDDERIRSLIPTLTYGCGQGWVNLLYGHRGRDPKLSLEPVAEHLKSLLGDAGVENPTVIFVADWLDDETGEVLPAAAKQVADAPDGSVVVLENTRKYTIEKCLWKENLGELEQNLDRITNYANGVRDSLAKFHANEGFAASNPDLSSVVVPFTMEKSVLGKYISGELRQHVTRTRQAELVVFSGLKIQKLDDLQKVLNRGQVKMVVAAGSLALALKKAAANLDGQDFELGLANDESKKIYIPQSRIEQAEAMITAGRKNGVEFVLPVDFVLFDGSPSDTIPPDGAQLDVGPKTRELQAAKMGEFIEFSNQKKAAGNGPAVMFYNGVFGKFEEEQFAQGTKDFIQQLKRLTEAGVETYVGGGEGGFALKLYGQEEWVTHCFTAGGTLLKALGTEPIPYLKALTLCAQAE